MPLDCETPIDRMASPRGRSTKIDTRALVQGTCLVLIEAAGFAANVLLVVLGLGIANMARSDENQPSRSNKLMRLRVMIQAVVIALLVLIGFMAGAIHF